VTTTFGGTVAKFFLEDFLFFADLRLGLRNAKLSKISDTKEKIFGNLTSKCVGRRTKF
jgi:hypothetical protein